MKTFKTKLLASALITTMLLGLVSCDLFKKFDEEAVNDVVTEYLDLFIANKYSKAAKLTSKGKDIVEKKVDEDDQEVFDAIVASTEYEIIATVGEKDVAKCTVKLEYVDVEDCVASLDIYSDDAFIHAIKKADTHTKKLAIELEYDSDAEEWLISNDVAIVQVYLDQFEDTRVKSVGDIDDIDDDDDKDEGEDQVYEEFSEELACKHMEEHLDQVLGMTVEDLYRNALASDPDLTLEEFIGDMQPYYDFMFDSLHMCYYEYEIYDITDNVVTFNVTAFVPDTDDLSDYFLKSDKMVKLFSDMMFDPNYDENSGSLQIIDAMLDYIHDNPTYKRYYTSTSISYSEEKGQYYAEGFSDVISQLVPNLDFGNTLLADGEFLTRVAEYCYENGIVGETQYEALLLEAETIGNAIMVEEGSDFLDFKMYEDPDFKYVTKLYRDGDPGLYILFHTQNNYTAYDTFTVTVEKGDEVLLNGAMGYSGRNRNNEGKILLDGPITAGEYKITIIGFNGETFATIYINIME